MTKEEAEKFIRLLQDLGWEYQRMSTSGQTTLNEIYDMVGIEPMEDDRHLDIEYMMNKVEGEKGQDVKIISNHQSDYLEEEQDE
jgi:Holliday junction resolvase|tara:strand:+ start:118 stop:369 length:252 start_codon:yes stop_codon:yes gene_type:complete